MALDRKRPVAQVPDAMLNKEIAQVHEEKLAPEPGDDLESIDEEVGPVYTREEIGPRIGVSGGNPIADRGTVEKLKEELDTMDMIPLLFPHKVSLQDKGLMHHWEAGVHLVPVELAKHAWLRTNKVRKAGPVVKQPVDA